MRNRACLSLFAGHKMLATCLLFQSTQSSQSTYCPIVRCNGETPEYGATLQPQEFSRELARLQDRRGYLSRQANFLHLQVVHGTSVLSLNGISPIPAVDNPG